MISMCVSNYFPWQRSDYAFGCGISAFLWSLQHWKPRTSRLDACFFFFPLSWLWLFGPCGNHKGNKRSLAFSEGIPNQFVRFQWMGFITACSMKKEKRGGEGYVSVWVDGWVKGGWREAFRWLTQQLWLLHGDFGIASRRWAAIPIRQTGQSFPHPSAENSSPIPDVGHSMHTENCAQQVNSFSLQREQARSSLLTTQVCVSCVWHSEFEIWICCKIEA